MTRSAFGLLFLSTLLCACAPAIVVDTPAPTSRAAPRPPGAPITIDYVGVQFGAAPSDVDDALLLLVANYLRKSGLFAAVYEAEVAHEAPANTGRLALDVLQTEQLEGTASGMLKALVSIYSLGLLDFLVPYHYGYEVRLEASFEAAGGGERTYESRASGSASYSSLFADVRQVGIDTRGWHITMRQHRMHTGQAYGLRDIHVDNPGMRMRAAQYTSVQHARPFEIRGVACFPLHLVRQSYTRDRRPYHCQFRTHSSAPPQPLCLFTTRPDADGLPPAPPP